MTYFLSIKNIHAGSIFQPMTKNNGLNYYGVYLLCLRDQLLPSKYDPFPMGISLNDPESITVSLHWIHNISFIPKGLVDVLIHQAGYNETQE